MKQFWLVQKTDDALLGSRKGKRTKQLLAGPFPDSTAALNAMNTLKLHPTPNCIPNLGKWIAIVSGPKPQDTTEYFEFFDHKFQDQVDSVVERSIPKE